jgi:hypothetical protein
VSISNYAELKILDHVTGRAAFTIPTNTYVKLHTGDPGEDCTGSPAGETTRKVATWAAAGSGSIAISATLSWTNVSTAETYSHWSLWDTVGPAGGNPLWSGALSSNATVAIGDNFDITALTLSLD